MPIIGKDLSVRDLKKLAHKCRLELIQMLYDAGSGHPGGSLSEIEILLTIYFKYANVDPKNPDWEDRDRVILSKGHAAPGLYVVLANAGFFPKKMYKTLNQPMCLEEPCKIQAGTLTTHAEREIPGIEVSTGALAQGFSVAVGMALAGKHFLKKPYRVWVVVGDGELQEGQIWESAMIASKYGLDNIIAVVDRNRYQVDGATEVVGQLEPLYDKWASFGWEPFVADGHSFEDLMDKFNKALQVKGRPSVVIAKTVKGKGVSFMENTHLWHSQHLKKEHYEKAMAELREAAKADGFDPDELLAEYPRD